MTLKNAIDLIKQEYEKASEINYVNNPLAYALYQVWKKADREIVVKPKETDLTDKCGSCEWAMPTANVVEVVRCKDCKYFSEFHHCGILGFCEPDEYCSRGERRNEDE